MQKTGKLMKPNPFANRSKHKFMLLFIFAFTALNMTFSGSASSGEPLSVKVGAYENHPKIFMDAKSAAPIIFRPVSKKILCEYHDSISKILPDCFHSSAVNR